MLHKITKNYSNLKIWLNNKDLYHYLGQRKVHSFAPYPGEIYTNMLKQVLDNPNLNFQEYDNTVVDQTKVNVYHRHDIDTQACIDNMPQMFDINLQLGIKTGVYFLVHPEYYNLADYKDVVLKYREAGLEMGLHTQCYLEDNYLDYFKHETEMFEKALGFSPRTFTIHGKGSLRFKERREFTKKIIKCLDDYGYDFTDCEKAFRKYEYVIEDCHWNAVKEKRYIFDDFVDFPKLVKKPQKVLILTHPCYWAM